MEFFLSAYIHFNDSRYRSRLVMNFIAWSHSKYRKIKSRSCSLETPDGRPAECMFRRLVSMVLFFCETKLIRYVHYSRISDLKLCLSQPCSDSGEDYRTEVSKCVNRTVRRSWPNTLIPHRHPISQTHPHLPWHELRGCIISGTLTRFDQRLNSCMYTLRAEVLRRWFKWSLNREFESSFGRFCVTVSHVWSCRPCPTTTSYSNACAL